MLQDIIFNNSTSQRLQDFSLQVKIACAAFVISLTNPFVPCEILLSRTYSGLFWRVSESRYSLISIKYWQLQTRSVLYAPILYFPLLRYWSDVVQVFFVMFCFSLSGVWSFIAVQYKIQYEVASAFFGDSLGLCFRSSVLRSFLKTVSRDSHHLSSRKIGLS